MLLFVLSVLVAFSPFPAPDVAVEWLGEMTFDVGDIPRGKDYRHSFQFKNLTDAPIVVDNVRVGCGCTATDWEEVPVAPGAVGSINVTYDSMNGGYFRKYVKVYFVGHRGGHKLYLTGYVE
ncbi:DUF1573 domain-containing protein [Neolewinella antarctica]|uniref:DUF1573 domain-containing protein n=1 Tax=Neolewinella antarctica TaxID=442734 RepID=A0ABX0X6E5_9BACT|nr:DUF1573 domain-containing protein [Neolewinella antarctica]NJC24584.1 hypothetical protein [Neolewinella antarctica]